MPAFSFHVLMLTGSPRLRQKLTLPSACRRYVSAWSFSPCGLESTDFRASWATRMVAASGTATAVGTSRLRPPTTRSGLWSQGCADSPVRPATSAKLWLNCARDSSQSCTAGLSVIFLGRALWTGSALAGIKGSVGISPINEPTAERNWLPRLWLCRSSRSATSPRLHPTGSCLRHPLRAIETYLSYDFLTVYGEGPPSGPGSVGTG